MQPGLSNNSNGCPNSDCDLNSDIHGSLDPDAVVYEPHILVNNSVGLHFHLFELFQEQQHIHISNPLDLNFQKFN